MKNWWYDFVFAGRVLRKNWFSTLVILISLGIGIGANTAIFSVVDALLLRPLPYPQPDRLAGVWLHSPAIGIFRDWPSPGQYVDLKNENHSFEQMALAQIRPDAPVAPAPSASQDVSAPAPFVRTNDSRSSDRHTAPATANPEKSQSPASAATPPPIGPAADTAAAATTTHPPR